MLIASGQSEEYFIIEQDIENNKKESKTIYVEKRRVSLGEYALFVIGYEGKVDEPLREKLQDLCQEERCLFIQLETIDYTWTIENSSGKYYKKFIPPYTALIDLSQSEEDILQAMKPKGRYNIRLAEKKGVTVDEVEPTQENVALFHKLMEETTQRDSFAWNSLEFYTSFLQLPCSKLFFARHEEDLLAAAIMLGQGDVMYYYYGASSSKKRNLMAPYLLQWMAIRDAKQADYEIYDFLGVAGDDEKNSPLQGVTDFKIKLSPRKSRVSESYLYVNKSWKYLLIQLLRSLKK